MVYGIDGGWHDGMYLQVTYTSLDMTFVTSSAFPGGGIFEISPQGLFWHNRACNYAGTDTVASCPPTNCQLASCNSRNIMEGFGADYCTGVTNPTGPTVANTNPSATWTDPNFGVQTGYPGGGSPTNYKCGISVLATSYPIVGTAEPINSIIVNGASNDVNTGNTKCPCTPGTAGYSSCMATVMSTFTYASGSTTTVTKSSKKAMQLGVGIGVGVGGGLLLMGIVLYFTVLKKKNIETGQKSAVMMTPVAAKV